jgi:molybdopterin-containing oxidoreductase family iron-sulfur binding subunit
METTRRGFLQVAGLATLGLVVAKPATLLFSKLSGSDASSASGILATSEGSVGTTQLAMVIDINACNEYKQEHGGCNLCEVACHQWHKVPNIPEHEEEIKWIWEDKYGKVFEEHLIKNLSEEDTDLINLPVKLLCNQCTNPACIKYCPTRATWRRESDGVVMVDYHRCIGCRYCMAGCPYGARSFNWRNPRTALTDEDMNPESDFPTRTRGVVEKCNFCADILQMDDNGDPKPGYEPKCVAACEAKALVFGDMLNENSQIRHLLEEHQEHIMRRLPELGTNPNNYYIL